MRVAILDDIHDAYDRTAGIKRLRERAEVRIFNGPFGNPSNLRGFDALVANRERTRFDRALLEQLPDLRIVAQTGNHAYHVDLKAAEEHGIIFASAAGGFSYGAAELTLALAMCIMRQIPAVDRGIRQGEWPAPLSYILYDKTIGLVGFGGIGQQVSRVANVMGMHVLAWTPRLTPERAAEFGATYRPLDDLLRESDIVSIHASLSPESRGLIGAERLALMKPTAYLVNTARGPIVNEQALIDALRNNRIAGAGLDVFDQEPLPRDHPLRSLPNTVLTSHIGWPTDNAYERFADAAATVLIDYLEDRPIPRITH